MNAPAKITPAIPADHMAPGSLARATADRLIAARQNARRVAPLMSYGLWRKLCPLQDLIAANPAYADRWVEQWYAGIDLDCRTIEDRVIMSGDLV
jgi:hypothetical protein